MSKDLYIKHIAPTILEEELRKLFGVCGKVTYVHMVKDPKTNEFLGCAYVKMSTEAEAKDAIVTLDGARLGNREIVVIEALPQRPGGNKGAAGKSFSKGPAPDAGKGPDKPFSKGPTFGEPKGPGKPLSKRPAFGAPKGPASRTPAARPSQGPAEAPDARGPKGPRGPAEATGYKGPKRPQNGAGRKTAGPGASFGKVRGPGKSGGRGK